MRSCASDSNRQLIFRRTAPAGSVNAISGMCVHRSSERRRYPDGLVDIYDEYLTWRNSQSWS